MNVLKKAIMVNNHTKITAHHLLNRLCCASRSSTIKEIMTFWKTRFENSDVSEADISIRLIISHVLGIQRVRNFIIIYVITIYVLLKLDIQKVFTSTYIFRF